MYVVRDCGFSRAIWKSIVPRSLWNVFFRLPTAQWIIWNIQNEGTLVVQKGEWTTFFSIMSWFLWKSRNDFIFKQKSGSSQTLLTTAETWTRSLGVKGGSDNWSCNSMTTGCCQFPANEWTKVNVDGSLSTTRPKATIGGVVRFSS